MTGNWTEDDPSAGDLDGVRTMSERIRTRGRSELEYAANDRGTTTATLTVWSGESADAWAGMSERTVAHMESFGTACVTGSAAIDVYTGEVEQLQTVYRSKRRMFDDAVEYAERVGLVCTPYPLDGELHTMVCALAPPDANGRPTLGDLDIAQNDIDTAARGLQALVEHRRALDSTLASALHTMVGDWPAQSAALRTAGVPDPGLLGVDAMIERLKDLSAQEIAELWPRLPRDVVDQLIAADPTLIGNLEGAAYADRSTANVSRLEGLRTQARREVEEATQLNGLPGPNFALELAQQRLRAAEFLYENYAGGVGLQLSPPQYLISLDTNVIGVPLAAISVGNLDTATSANFFVPGMGSDLNQANDYLRGTKRLQSADPSGAAILWLGYRSPDAFEVLSTGRAEAGGKRLGTTLDGFNAIRSATGSRSTLNIVAHSYGTTTTAFALDGGDYGVDTFTMIGSAGIPYGIRIDDLNMSKNDVYVTRADLDMLGDIGQNASFRHDPEEWWWGANAFGSDGTDALDPVTEHNAVGSNEADDRYKYLGDGTESLANIKLILQGNGDQITAGRRPTLPDGTPNFGDRAKKPHPAASDFSETFERLKDGNHLPLAPSPIIPPVKEK